MASYREAVRPLFPQYCTLLACVDGRPAAVNKISQQFLGLGQAEVKRLVIYKNLKVPKGLCTDTAIYMERRAF